MSATSGFDDGWLALREPIDAAARAPALASRLASIAGSARPLQVLDLGAGTGANLRYLAPRLGGEQQWRLLDHDRTLLDAIDARMRAFAASTAWTFGGAGPDGVVRGCGFACRFTPVQADLRRIAASLPLSRGTVVTASALLDLVSSAWLHGLLARCHAFAAPVLFALSYDGRMRCEPAEPEDRQVRALLNRHQQRDKGFGPALGPAAASTAAGLLARLGYEVCCKHSDWRLTPEHAGLQGLLVDGWLAAACAVEPQAASALGEWHRRRCAHIEAGRSVLQVGHTDVLGWPPRSENPLEPAGA